VEQEVARVHAHAAAALAFTRAQEQKSMDLPRSNPHRPAHRRSNTDITHKQNAELSVQRPGSAAAGNLKKQHSVRFVGEKSIATVQHHGLRARAGNHPRTTPLHGKLSAPSLRPRALTNDTPVPAAYQPRNRTSSIGKTHDNDSIRNHINALQAYDEYYTRDDDGSSTPSSYRRLRRTQSMVQPKDTPSVLFNNGTASPGSAIASTSKGTHARTWTSNAASAQGQPLKPARSLSFLQTAGRRRSGVSSSAQRSSIQYDESVQLARDHFLQEVNAKRLREQQSFVERQRETNRSFRRSLRTVSSTNSYGLPIASRNQVQQTKVHSLRIKARNASKNIGRKLKSLFGGKKDDGGMPPQEVQAKRSHGFTPYQLEIGPASGVHMDYVDVPEPDAATMSRVSSRQPGLHAVPSHQQLRSLAGSMQSLRSEVSRQTACSRISSWTDSERTASGAFSSTEAASGLALGSGRPTGWTALERERQRLSIINENGTHHISSSFTRPQINVNNPYSVFPTFSSPTITADQLPGIREAFQHPYAQYPTQPPPPPPTFSPPELQPSQFGQTQWGKSDSAFTPSNFGQSQLRNSILSPAETQRVFSALVKHMDQKNQSHTSTPEGKGDPTHTQQQVAATEREAAQAQFNALAEAHAQQQAHEKLENEERFRRASTLSLEPPNPIPLRTSSAQSRRSTGSVVFFKQGQLAERRGSGMFGGSTGSRGSADSAATGENTALLLQDFGAPVKALVVNETGSVGYKSGSGNRGSRTRSVSLGTKLGKEELETLKKPRRQVNCTAVPPPVMGDLPAKYDFTPRQESMHAVAHATISGVSNGSTGKAIGAKLRETKSTFFGRSEVSLIGRAASPYRKALQEAEHQKQEQRRSMHVASGRSGSAESSPFLPSALRAHTTNSPEDDVKSTGSESIYSRTTSGHTPRMGSLNSPPPVPEPYVVQAPYAVGADSASSAHDRSLGEVSTKSGKSGHGSMILLDRHIARRSGLEFLQRPGPEPTQGHKPAKSGGSIEWRNWIGREVEQLERPRGVLTGPKSTRPSLEKASGGTGGNGQA
jgi:hypothetical protein